MAALSNKKYEFFAQEIAGGAPAGVAYVTAGFADTASAPFNGGRLKARPDVAARIEELRNEVAEATFTDRLAEKIEWVRSKFYPALDFDPIDIFEQPNPVDPLVLRLKPLEKIPPRARKQITKIKTDPESGRMVEITFADRVAIGNMIFRSLPGGDVTRHEVTGPNGSPLQVTVSHLVDRLYTDTVLQNAGPKKLEILSRVRNDLLLLAAEEAGEPIDVDAEEIEG